MYRFKMNVENIEDSGLEVGESLEIELPDGDPVEVKFLGLEDGDHYWETNDKNYARIAAFFGVYVPKHGDYLN